MYQDRFFQLVGMTGAKADATTEAGSLTTSQQATTPPSGRTNFNSNIPHWLPFSLIVIWAAVIVWFWQRQRYNSGRGSDRRRVRCRNCTFFKDNPYLKCAVHPTIALTPKALDCSDYMPQVQPLTTRPPTRKYRL